MENVPIYVKVDKYKELLDALKAIETKLDNVNRMIERINTLKSQEDAQIKQWTDNVTDIKARLGKITEAFHQG
jgi:predicted nuclease with TOPRIM domain